MKPRKKQSNSKKKTTTSEKKRGFSKKELSDMSREWRSFVKETRGKLGVTRKDFAHLLGISLSTLNSWEYVGVIPDTLHQTVVVLLNENSIIANKTLASKSGKAKFMSPAITDQTARAWQSFWRGTTRREVAVGAVGLICNTLKLFESAKQYGVFRDKD